MLEAVSETGASGALAWSLRTRNRDGGFYWHSEPAGGNKYKSFHWPGFASGDDYDETKFLAIMQRKALEIRGLSAPAASVPAPPTLLPIADAAAISWQGSVGATDYMVERALRESGPWQIAGNGVDETAVQYRPLFADTQAAAGQWYYRVSARNPAGLSRPSNVVGPVLVKHATLVDEMMDFSRVAERHGTLEIKSRDCRQAKEDAHRLAGQSGSVVVYHVAEPIQTVKLDAFFPTAVADFRLAVSEDGRNYASLSAERTVYDSGAGDYGYWKSARFQARVASSGARFLKVEFAAEAQIFRLEIAYGHAQ
jgi:hypothetical protein